MDENCVYVDKYFKVSIPNHPFNSREDGGHLVLTLHNPVTDRSDLTVEQAINFMRVTMMVGRAMYDVLGVKRMNYEDLGNSDPRLHLHFFGRAHKQLYQVPGFPIALIWPKGHPIYTSGIFDPLSQDEIDRLRDRVKELSRDEKYVRMAQLAGIEDEDSKNCK